MENKLEVSFNSPQCGWMSIGFSDAENEFHTTTAHTPHERALPELLRILSALLDEDATQTEYVLHWNRDPEEFDFRFVRSDDRVRLEIYQYPSEVRETENRELVYSHEGKITDVCETFAETFNQLYADRETDEFEFNWRQPFPFAEYEEFKKKIPTGKRELDD
jgi:hypothetical protein